MYFKLVGRGRGLTIARGRGKMMVAHRLLQGILPLAGEGCQTEDGALHTFTTSLPGDVVNSFHANLAAATDSCRAGGSCRPCDLAQATRATSTRPDRLRCSFARARSIQRIHSAEPRIDNPGRALGLWSQFSTVLTCPPHARQFHTFSCEHI